MAIGNLIDYERVMRFELKSPAEKPKDRKPLGIFYDLKSSVCAAARDVRALHLARAAMFRAKGEDAQPEYVAQTVLNNSTEELAACIVGWEWNGEEIDSGEGEPAFTPENVKRFLALPWVKDQVEEARDSIVNFTKA